MLDFLLTTDVGRWVSAEDDAEREASEWKLWEREEPEKERRMEAEGLGAWADVPLFLLTPSFMVTADEE